MRIPLWILCFSISNVSSLVEGGAAVSEPTRVMHPGDFQFSTTTSTLFTLLLSSLLPHPPGTEKTSSKRARTHQGRSAGRGKRGRSQQPGESDGDPECKEPPAAALPRGARPLRPAPRAPNPQEPDRSPRRPGPAPRTHRPEPPGGRSFPTSSRSRKSARRSLGSQQAHARRPALALLPSRAPLVRGGWPIDRENSHGWPIWETLGFGQVSFSPSGSHLS